MARPRAYTVTWHRHVDHGRVVPVVVFAGVAGGPRDAVRRALAQQPFLPPAHLTIAPDGAPDRVRRGDDLLRVGFARPERQALRHGDPVRAAAIEAKRQATVARKKEAARQRNEALRRRQLARYT